MRQVVRSMFVILAIAGVIGASYGFAWTVYGFLEDTPISYLWGTLFIFLVVGWVYYFKWAWAQIHKKRRESVRVLPEQGRKQDYARKQVLAVLSSPDKSMLPEYSPDNMQALEEQVHEWNTRGDQPGSLAGRAIGLELIDDYLEGNV